MKTKALITAAIMAFTLGGCYAGQTWAELDARCPDNQVEGGASTGWGGGTVGCKGDLGYPGKPVSENNMGSASGAVAR